MITYQWVVKNISEDFRGYVTKAYFEMKGVDKNNNEKTSSVTVVFGNDEIKPKENWSQQDIDNYANKYLQHFEQEIEQQFTNNA